MRDDGLSCGLSHMTIFVNWEFTYWNDTGHYSGGRCTGGLFRFTLVYFISPHDHFGLFHASPDGAAPHAFAAILLRKLSLITRAAAIRFTTKPARERGRWSSMPMPLYIYFSLLLIFSFSSQAAGACQFIYLMLAYLHDLRREFYLSLSINMISTLARLFRSRQIVRYDVHFAHQRRYYSITI